MESQGKGIYKAAREAVTLTLAVGLLLIFVGGTALMAGPLLSVARAFPQGQNFSVNSSVDDANAHDNNPGDGWCLDTYERCTLRAAIEEANAYAGADAITFAQAMSIYLDTGQGALPQITEQLKIDASGVWDSGNDRPGVMLSCSSGGFRGLRLAADSSEVYGLFIANCRDAVEITSAYSTVGGPNTGRRNVLSNSDLDGVAIWGSNAHHNVIQSNWIGLSVTGDTKGPNGTGVVIFDGAHDNTIGGDTAAKGNHISGNTFQGVMIQDTGSDGNRLGGNVIGLPAVGSQDVGNGTDGVYINTGPQNTKIGNIGAGLMGNTISMNQETGIYIKNANNNWVQENSINSNKLHGVYVNGGAGNQILANTIAHNTTYGVYVYGTTATGNAILTNSIHDNGDKGIRLFDGGNTELAAPVITAVSASGASGTACASCMIHIYSDSDGEGETYHGSVNADASGNWSYSGTLSGPNVTATNTDASNNTSEFSAPKSITGPTQTPTPTPTPASCSDRIQNGGFETGDFSSWTTIGTPWIAGYLAHDGSYSGVVGGADNADDTFYQEVVLPATADSAILTYWWYIYTQTGIGTPMDYLHVEAQDTSGVVLATLATLHDQSPTGGWFQETIDLRDYPALFGRTVRIAFHGVTDSSNFTSFYIDDVKLEVCGASTSTPTPTPTGTPTPANTPTATATSTPGCPGDYAGDTFAAATDIIADNEYTAYLCPTGDEDWFKFSVVSGQKITLQLYNLPADYDLQLYSPTNTLLVDGHQSGTTGEQIFWTAATAGEFRARVYSPGGAASATGYNLRLLLDEPPTATFTPTPTCSPDSYESNDDADHAYNMGDLHNAPQIFPNQSICPANDEDWFSSQLHPDDRIIAELTHDSAQGPLRMCLVDKDKSTALSCTHYDIGLNRIDYFIPAEGRYYIRVEAATPGDINPNYSTEIGVTSPTPTWTPTATHTPTPTPTPTLTPTITPTPTQSLPRADVELWRMEVTQSIQNLANNVPLFTGKDTYVRLYLKTDSPHWLKDVEGFLVGDYPGGVSGRIPCLNKAITAKAYDIWIQRENWGVASIECRVPTAWIKDPGRIEITATVNSPSISDTDPANNTKYVSTTILASPPMHIQAVTVKDGGFLGIGARGPAFSDYKNIHLVTQTMYPLSKVILHPPIASIPWTGDYLTLLGLAWVDVLTPDPGPNTVLVGMVRDNKLTKWGGMGLPTRHTWVVVNPKYRERVGFVAAHEMAHGFGMFHVDACNAGWPFENYPYPNEWLSKGGGEDHFGLYTGPTTPRVYTPRITSDLMTYCWPQWISDYTYNKLSQALQNGANLSAQKVSVALDTEYLVVVGDIDSDTQAVTLLPMMRLPGADLDPNPSVSPPGPYTLQLLSSDDTVLAEQSFSLMNGNHQSGGSMFTVLIPYAPSTDHIRIIHNAEPIHDVPVSAHTPTVSLNPIAGEIPDQLTVAWSASDADGDSLTANLSFSSDGGVTWQTVLLGHTAQQAELDTSLWPETTQGTLRVQVTDGVNTAEDVTGPFTVPSKSPSIFILSPENGVTTPPGLPIKFVASGYDPEDGFITNDDFAWTSDRDGDLGRGEELWADSLSPGWHQITVSASDSDENIVSDSIRVYVGQRVYLPMLAR